MEQYRRVEKQKVEDQIKENEIRVTTQGKMRSFISYATTLLKVKHPKKKKKKFILYFVRSFKIPFIILISNIFIKLFYLAWFRFFFF